MSDTQHSCVIIGIAGASASGKSLIAQTIYEELVAELGAGQIGVITEDCYYRDQTHLTMEERVKTNYDHPNALDHDLLVQHLTQLTQGEAVNIPQYSYTEHTRMTAVVQERGRLARDMHDTLAQAFTGLLAQVEAARRDADLAFGDDAAKRAGHVAQIRGQRQQQQPPPPPTSRAPSAPSFHPTWPRSDPPARR